MRFVTALLLLSSTVLADKVLYISYSRLLMDGDAVTSNMSSIFPYLSNSDDTPMEEFLLSSSFDYFGTAYDRVFVNPNGHVQFSKIPPCGQYFGYQGCNYNSSYYNTIAGYLADLNPAATPHSTVAFFQNDTHTTFLFSRIPPFAKETELTFSVSLFSDNSVRISYYDVTPLESITGDAASKYQWISGLRAPKNISSSAIITSSQRSTGLQQWKTFVSGVYAQRSDVSDGSIFVACPVSVTWCASPSLIQSSAWPDELVLTPLSISCASSLTVSIYLSSASSTNAVTSAEMCALQQGNDTHISRFVCDTSSFSGVASGNYLIRVLWRVDSVTSDALLSIDGLPITVQSGAVTEQCSLSATNTGACSACDVCAGEDLSCLSLSCDAEADIADHEIPDLYARLNCNGTCDTSVQSDVYADCCSVEDMDCMGDCYGTATNASSSFGWQICCVDEVDCEGVCGGGKRFDACNVCGGGDLSGETCPTYVRIDTGGDNNHELQVVYDATNTDPNYFVTSWITVANDNDTEITVNFSVTSDSKAPTVSIPSGEYTIQPFTNQSFAINSSIAELFEDSDLAWTVKVITLGYIRPTQFSNDLRHYIDLLPSSSNCQQVESPHVCMSLPGCIQCIDYDGIRVLREAEGCEESPRLGSRCSKRRHLYASIIPEIAGYNTHKLQHGICETGWDNNDCSTFNNSATITNYSILYIIGIAYLGFLIGVL